MLLHHRFVKTAKRFGGKLAFVDYTTEKRITYSRALVASLMLADRFRGFDGRMMGIMLPTGAGCALSMLGALMCGKTPVMINYSTGAEENAKYAQKKCGFKTIITAKGLLDKINCPTVNGMVFIEDIMEDVSVFEKLKALLRSKMPENSVLESIHGGRPDDNLMILFTSGSEKDPKAVQLTHRNVFSNVESSIAAFSLTDKDSVLANLPLFHVFGQTVTLWLPLYLGMTTVTYANPLDYKKVCTIVRTERPTVMVGTPSFLRGYLLRSEPGDFDSLRIAVSGADRCPDSLREGYLKKHNLTLLEGYGVTETSPVVSANRPEDNRPGSIGRVVSGVKVRIEHRETGEECLPGDIGKILVKGDLVMKGYFGDPEETARRIRDGWYDTGDMGYFDEEGYLWFAGRLKRFVKVGGEMVSLVKVEDVLEKLLDEDALCCVVDIPDEAKGARLVAAVTQKIDERAVLRKMAGQLPAIALPKDFIHIEELPRMASGKVDFRKTAQIVKELLSDTMD